MLDTTCTRPDMLAIGTAIAWTHGARYKFVECVTSDAALQFRRTTERLPVIGQRTHPSGGPIAGEAIAPSVLRELALTTNWTVPMDVLQTGTCHPSTPMLTIDSVEPFEENLQRVLRYLRG